MSAVPVAPQALQDPDAESIEPPSVDRELMSGRILHQACAHCPLAEDVPKSQTVHFHSRCIAGFGETISVQQNIDDLHVWNEKRTPPQDPQKGRQQGRSERRGEAYASVR